MTLLPAWLRAYLANDDPATSVANLVAMVVGWNTPIYPLYVIAVAGWPVARPAALTALATPVYLALPAIARRSSRLARFTLPTFGTLNTLWCTKLLGEGCDLRLFLLPCVLLSALLHRRDERPLLVLAIALALVAYLLPDRLFVPAVAGIETTAAGHLAALNEGSVLLLCVVIAWRFAAILRSAPDSSSPS